MTRRTRNVSRRRDTLTVEHRDITDTDRELLHQRRTFSQRERERLGLAPRAESPERTAPTFDRDLRRWLDRGYSEEMARELAAAGASVDARIGERPRKSFSATAEK